jgi:hypothetical protein
MCASRGANRTTCIVARCAGPAFAIAMLAWLARCATSGGGIGL